MTKYKFDSRKNSPIVKSSDKETPPEGAINTPRGLTDHAEQSSMAAEGNSNVVLSSRQLLPAAVGDFSVSRQVEYIPPPDTLVGQFAFDVCGTLSQVAQSADVSMTKTRQGFRQFMEVVARITAMQANTKGTPWETPREAEPKSNAA